MHTKEIKVFEKENNDATLGCVVAASVLVASELGMHPLLQLSILRRSKAMQ